MGLGVDPPLECGQPQKGHSGFYGCHRHPSGPFIPNQVTSNEILAAFPGVGADVQVKLTEVWAHQMEHEEGR